MNKHAELMRIASQIINVASPADFEYTKKLIEAAEEIERQEPVAYAVFAENGNIRIWCADPVQVETLRQQYGEELQPLYTAPHHTEQQPAPDVSALVEALEDIGASWHGVNTELERYMRNVARHALAAHRSRG